MTTVVNSAKVGAVLTRPRRLAVLLAAGALALTGCGGADGGGPDAGSGALRVVATTPVVADFVRSVGGDRVEVTGACLTVESLDGRRVARVRAERVPEQAADQETAEVAAA